MYKSRTLNILINLLLVFSALVITAGATEYFFYLNSQYNFITSKNQQPVYPTHPVPISEDIIIAANKLYPSSLYNQDDFEFKEKSKLLPLFTYSATQSPYATNLIRERPSDRLAIQLQETRLNGKVPIYSQTYSMSKGHSRISSSQSYDPAKKNFIALGCSIVFGVGIADDQTITGQLAKQVKNYNFYNFGVPGGGLTDALDDIYFQDRTSYINKQGGAVVYVFWWDHFRRFYAGLDVPLNKRISYEIKNDSLVRTLPYEKSSKFVINVLQKLERSHFLRFIGYGTDFYSQEKQHEFVDYVERLRDYYAKNHNLDFYFYILNPESIPSEYFLNELSKRKIKTISYQSIHEKLPHHESLIGGDGHYTGKANYIFASELKEAIRKDNPNF